MDYLDLRYDAVKWIIILFLREKDTLWVMRVIIDKFGSRYNRVLWTEVPTTGKVAGLVNTLKKLSYSANVISLIFPSL